MLKELSIHNFILVKEQHVDFRSGLNVLSGETGAGKSIILQAIELVLGGRSSTDHIRRGCDTWQIDALFDLSNLKPSTFNELPDIARAEELIISRSFTKAGRGKVYINGRLATVQLLNEVTQQLISICGQHQHVRLLDTRYHVDLLDSFANNQEISQEYSTLFNKFRELKKKILDITNREAERSIRQSELETTISELESLQLTSDLREKLEQEVRAIGNQEQILSEYQTLNSIWNDSQGAWNQLQQAKKVLSKISSLSSELEGSCQELIDNIDGLSDLEGELSTKISNVTIDPEALEQQRERLAEVARLERKHSTNCAGLITVLEESSQELENLTAEINLQELQAELDASHADLMKLANKLSKKRKKAAPELSKRVIQELVELNMQEVKFDTVIEPAELGPKGVERVEFQIAANKGSELKALSQVASGGELSRITLVLKKLLGDSSGVNVLVFDEVDSGISGSVARAMGQKLSELAKDSQVICITHLPQIASLADSHFLVEKTQDKQAKTSIRSLSDPERIEEVARMLAGYEITSATRESARELITSK